MQPLRVLLVDDEELILRAVRRHLTRVGHAAACATSADAALALIAREPFDVVVSDILMPGRGGLDLLRELRRLDCDVPVILMTGAPEAATADEAVALGAFAYLHKPFDTEALLATIERAAREVAVPVT